MKYIKKIQHPKWQRKRNCILERDNYICQSCGDNETMLHVHHLKYGKSDPWEVPNSWLITFCKNCHSQAHKFNTEQKIVDRLIELNIR